LEKMVDADEDAFLSSALPGYVPMPVKQNFNDMLVKAKEIMGPEYDWARWMSCANPSDGPITSEMVASGAATIARQAPGYDKFGFWAIATMERWASMGTLLTAGMEAAPEVTFDLTLVNPLFDAFFRCGFLALSREKKSQASFQMRGLPVKKADSMVIMTEAFAAELFLFESSLSVSSRKRHAIEDRTKIAHLVISATVEALRANGIPDEPFGAIGAHLWETSEKGVLRLTVTTAVLNTVHHCFEIHTLCSFRLPTDVNSRSEAAHALTAVQHMLAVGLYLEEQARVLSTMILPKENSANPIPA
jgi:hypothetical protein